MQVVLVVKKLPKKYGFWKFMWDMFMIVMSGGLWLIWMVIRHIRTH